MASAADPYLYEFLYRGRAPGSDQAPDYHVILGQDTKDAFGGSATALSQALTPEQAKALGFDLTKIVASVDAGVMTENTGLKTQLEAAAADRADLQSKLDSAIADNAGWETKLEAAATEKADLEAKLTAALQAKLEAVLAKPDEGADPAPAT